MAHSWRAGLLRSLFGIKADTTHWKAVGKWMEESLGNIRIDTSENNTSVRAFFKQQTLIGDDSRINRLEYTHVLMCLDMEEAVGKGATREDAIVALWDKVTTLAEGQKILRVEKVYDYPDAFASYTSFTFQNGTFFNEGDVAKEPPPARPAFIDKYFEGEPQRRLIAEIEQSIFGPGPKGAGA